MELKDIMDFMGIEADDMESFKTNFSTKYHTEKQIHENKDLIGKFTGKTLLKIKLNILKKAREEDIPFTHNEFENVDLEDMLTELDKRKSESFTSKLTDLQGQIGKSGEEAIKPFQEKLSKFELALADEKKAKSEIANQFDQFKQESEGRIKSTRIDYFKKDLMTSIDYDPLAMKDELKKMGWESHISNNFKFDFDEQDQPIILDKSGSKIKNPKKADEWLSPKDVLTAEADKLGLIKKNQQGGQPAFQRPMPGQPNQPGQPPVVPNFQPAPGGAAKPNRLAKGMDQYLSK